MVFAELAQRVAVLGKFLERQEGERNVRQVGTERRASQLRHDFFFPVVRRDEVELATAAGNRAGQIFQPFGKVPTALLSTVSRTPRGWRGTPSSILRP